MILSCSNSLVRREQVLAFDRPWDELLAVNEHAELYCSFGANNVIICGFQEASF